MSRMFLKLTAQASLAKVIFLAELWIKPGFLLESNAGMRQNLRKGEHLLLKFTGGESRK